MARKSAKPADAVFVGTVYANGTYLATRKDGSVTFGPTNHKGVNVQVSSPKATK